MKKNIFTLTGAVLLLSGCAVFVDAGAFEHYGDDQSSLTVRADSDAEMTVSCSEGREPYSQGGEGGEPLVMGCRAEADAPAR